MLKREKITFCSLQGLESRTVRSSYRERGFHSKGTRSGGAPQTRRGVFPVGTARPASWLGFRRQCDLSTGWVAAPFSCLPTLGVYVCLMPLPSRLCIALPGKRGIIVALLQHFLHDGPCQIPSQGCVGWVSLNVLNLKPIETISSHAGP